MARSRSSSSRKSGRKAGKGSAPGAGRRGDTRRSKSGDLIREDGPLEVRIVGGEFRARKLQYHGNICVRPMKDRTREAVFNLIGPFVRGSFVLDLFAGTGAMALEAMSRGASGALMIERHMPTVKVIQRNVSLLKLEDRVEVSQGDTFFWARKLTSDQINTDPDVPWLVFCCPPYALYKERLDDITTMLQHLRSIAPADSRFLIEAEIPFDVEQFWEADWRVREYSPAVIGYSR